MPFSYHKTTKIVFIELCRFVFAFCLIWFHFGCVPFLNKNGEWAVFHNGYLIVEYFFILTGYFSVAHIEKTRGQAFSIGSYVLHKYISLLPYMALSVFCAYPLIFVGGYPKRQILNFPLEIFGLYKGFSPEAINLHLWFVGAMIIALPILLYSVTKLKHDTLLYLSFVIPLLIYGYILNDQGTLDSWAFQLGILRALAGMFLGCFLYYVSIILRGFKFTLAGKITITIIEVSTFGIALIYLLLPNYRYDIFFIFIISISLLCTFSHKSFLNNLSSRFLCFLGNLSMPIYFFHYPIIKWIEFLLPDANVKFQMLLLFVSTIFISCLSLWFVKKLLPIVSSKLWSLFVIPR